jgi:hypothetical protein
MIQKTTAFLLALLLVVTIVPAALADTGNDSNGSTNDTSNNSNWRGPGGRIIPRGAMLDARLNATDDRREGTQTALDDRRQERVQLRLNFSKTFNDFKNMTTDDRKAFLKEFQDRREQIREEFKQNLERFKEQFKQDLDKLKTLRAQFQGERQDFLKAKQDLRDQCKNGNISNTTSCRDAQHQLAESGRGFMGNSAEQMLRIINTTKTRISTNPNIDNETASAIVAQLDDRSAAVQAAKKKIDALDNTSTVNETKAAAGALRAAWQEARVTIRLSEGLLTHARFQAFINHLNAMDVRFKEARDNLSASGKNVTALNTALTAFETKIGDVTASYQQAKDSYLNAMETATTEADANALLKSTSEQLKTVRQDAMGARDSLRDIVKALRDLDPKVLEATSKKIADDTDASQSDIIDGEVSP